MNSVTKSAISAPAVNAGDVPQGKAAVVVSAEESLKAQSIAQRLFTEIDSLEDEISNSKRLASEIEGRGIFKRVVSSSSKDLAAIAKTQNSINRRMVDLIQETIRLNMLSCAGLVFLMDEMRKGIENGFTDANGNIIRLGREGRDLAEAATDIISGILDTSKGTQERINQNSEAVEQISQKLEAKDQLDSEQDEAIALLERQIRAKEKLDEQQTANIQYLLKKIQVKQIKIEEQKNALEKLTVQFSLLNEKLSNLEIALQQHQGDALGQIAGLGSSLRNWRWVTVALALVPTVWLAIVSFY